MTRNDKVLTLTTNIGHRLCNVQSAALSPDGSEVLFVAVRPREADEGPGEKVAELFCTNALEGSVRKLDHDGTGPHAPGFSPDGKLRSWLARTTPGLNAALVTQDRYSGETTRYGEIEGDILQYSWSPTGRYLALAMQEPLSAKQVESLKRGRDEIVVGGCPRQVQISIFDMQSRSLRLLTDNTVSIGQFEWSVDGDMLVATAAPSPDFDDRALRSQVILIDARSGNWRVPTRHLRCKSADPCIAPSGSWVAWRSGVADNDPYPGNVFVMNIVDHQVREVFRDRQETAVQIEWLPNCSATLLIRTVTGEYTKLYRYSPDTEAFDDLGTPVDATGRPLIVSALPSTKGRCNVSRDGARICLVASTPLHPDEVFVGPLSGPLVRRTDHNPRLCGLALGNQEAVTWRSESGLSIGGVLIKPPHFEIGRRYPLVLQIHGGSEEVYQNGWLGDYPEDILPQLLAARGYLVLCPNYRGSIGRGAEFAMGEHDDVMGRSFIDILRGIDYLVESGLADAGRVAIAGYSWGGLAAAWGATFWSKRFRAAVVGGPITNWITHSGASDTRLHDQVAHWNCVLYEGNYQKFLERSPIYHISKAQTPTLILTGQLDMSAPSAQAWELYSALKWKGVDTRLVVYPREQHVFVEQDHQLDYVERALEWIAAHVPSGVS